MTFSVDRVTITYGLFTAVREISFVVQRGEFLCLVGPNGAGKSSTIMAIGGVVRPSSGSISLDGKNLVGMAPEAIARRGIAIVPEGRHVFGSLSVRENLLLGTSACGGPSGHQEVMDRVLLLFPILRERLYIAAGKLSGGEQQQLVIGRSLMSRPKLLLIDEPALGLAPKVIGLVYRSLATLRREFDLTVIVVEQSLKRALDVADRILIMRAGIVMLEDTSDRLRENEQARNAYFGFET
jgi:branched-chain amino acid transport system ATP-binding protein